MAKYTEAKKKNNQKWDAENLRRGAYAMPIDLYMAFDRYCNDNGLSKNGLINQTISEKIGYTATTGKDAE